MPLPLVALAAAPKILGALGAIKGVAGAAGAAGGGGGALPTAVGGAQLLLGNIQRARAKKMQPGQEDPMQVTAMQEYQRRANNAMTGANISNQMRDLAQMQGAGIKALSRGGNINQFGQVSRMQSKALNDILAQGQAQEESYRDMFNKQLESVSDRRMRVQGKAADAMNLRAEKNVAAGTQGIMAGLAKMGGGKSATPSADGGASQVADRGLMASQGGSPGAIPGITQPELNLGGMKQFQGIGSMMDTTGSLPFPIPGA
jgi:hypothetical protein